MTDAVQASEAVYEEFQAAWGSDVPLVFDQEDDGSLAIGDVAWARLAVREVGGGQDTLGPIGSRIYRRKMIAAVQVFTLGNKGTAETLALTEKARNILEGRTFSGLDFINCSVRRSSPKGKFDMSLVEANFEYDQVK